MCARYPRIQALSRPKLRIFRLALWIPGQFGLAAAEPSFDLGDLNCDGEVNAFDIDPFVLALTKPAGYAAAWANCDITNADINGDGVVNAFDIDPFVDLLTGG